MSVDNLIGLYADSPSEIIKLLQKLYPSDKNEVTEGRCFLNDHINVFVHSLSQTEIKWKEEDYDVHVNHVLSFQYFSNSNVNSADELMYVMERIVSLLNCDLMYQPNGDEPTMIRRSGILISDSEFDRYFGDGASDSLRKANSIIITADMSMEEIMERCEEKFGDDFNWFMLPPEKRQGLFVNELKIEVGENDMFFDGQVYAVYKCEANDDILFRSIGKDGNELWRIYHLTYSHCRECEGFPRRYDFESGQKAAEYIISRYIEDNENCDFKL